MKIPAFYRAGITRQFLLFFIVSAVTPILLVSVFLLWDVHLRLEAQRTNLLNTGGQLALSLIQNELEQLALVADQVAMLSTQKTVMPLPGATQLAHPNPITLGSGQPSIQVEQLLANLSHSKHLDWVLILNRQGQVVYTRGISKQEASSRLLGTLKPAITLSSGNRQVYGLSQASAELSEAKAQKPGQTPKPLLYFTAIAPFVDGEQTWGTLVLGQEMGEHFHMEKLHEVLPALDIQILESVRSNRLHTDQWRSVYASARQIKNSAHTLRLPLTDINQRVVGKLIVSLPTEGEARLYHDELLLTVLYLLIGLLFLVYLGWKIHRMVVRPLQEFSNASRQVAQGQLSVRVSEDAASLEVKQAFQQFNQMLKNLEENEQLRNTFISSLTHDLRTPLLAEQRVIKLFLDFKDELPQQFSNLTQGLEKSNQHLIEMVNTMLEAYQLEAGKIHVAASPIHLAKIVNGCFEKLMPLAEENNIHLRHTIADDFPAFEADNRLLRRLLVNLIANAIDNIDTGNTVTLNAACEQPGVTICVEDNGPGIPAEALPHLFEQYTTARLNRQKIASGLGLFICKMIIEAHGGTITVSSSTQAETHGTRFTLFLPSQNPGN